MQYAYPPPPISFVPIFMIDAMRTVLNWRLSLEIVNGKTSCKASCCCDDNKINMARKPGKKQKENPVWCTGEGKI